ncbi:calmodulin-like isoform X1 [Montipora foliosa]|uniref:calmodulin-like isoform X1 n=2 Tax=Montipora foliosa TaxID=591990 RepID=UPI0035F19553
MEKLTSDEIKEYVEVFEVFGQDENGRISTNQLRQAMQLVGLNPTDTQIQNLINEREYDGDGFLEFPDFIKTVEEYKKPGDKADLIMLFRVFDPENKGYVEAEEIRDALHRLKDLSKEEIEDLLEDADLKQNRHVYFDEFSRLLVPLINRDLDIIYL